jgi:hypothetical protein
MDYNYMTHNNGKCSDDKSKHICDDKNKCDFCKYWDPEDCGCKKRKNKCEKVKNVIIVARGIQVPRETQGRKEILGQRVPQEVLKGTLD